MCGKPKVVQQDPEGDARKAAEKATAEANLKKSIRRTSTSTSGTSALGGQIEGAKTKSTLGGG